MRLSDLNVFREFTRGKLAGFALQRLKDQNVSTSQEYIPKTVLLTVSQRCIYVDYGYFVRMLMSMYIKK